MRIKNKGGLWTTEKAVDDDRSRLTVAEQQCYAEATLSGAADAEGLKKNSVKQKYEERREKKGR